MDAKGAAGKGGDRAKTTHISLKHMLNIYLTQISIATCIYKDIVLSEKGTMLTASTRIDKCTPLSPLCRGFLTNSPPPG